MSTPTWQAATSGYASYAGQVNQFITTHGALLYYAGTAPNLYTNPTSYSTVSTADHVSNYALAQSFQINSVSAINLSYIYLPLVNIGAGCDVLVTIQPSNGSQPVGYTAATAVTGASAIVPAEWITSATPIVPGSSTSTNLVPIPLYPQPSLSPGVTYYVTVTPYANCIPTVNDVAWARNPSSSSPAYRAAITGAWSTTGTTALGVSLYTGNTGNLVATVEDQGALVKAYAYNSANALTGSYEWAYAQANPNALCRDDAMFTTGIGTWGATNATLTSTGVTTTVTQPSTLAVDYTSTIASSPSTTALTSTATIVGNGASTTVTNTGSTTVSGVTVNTALTSSTTANSAVALSGTAATLTVTSTTGFPAAGGFRIYSAYTGGTSYYVTYTSTTSTTFVGCVIVAGQSSGSTYTTVVGNPIILANASANSTGTSQSTITVASTAGFNAAAGSITVRHGGTDYVVSYTSYSAGVFSGCSCATLFTLTTGDAITAGGLNTSSVGIIQTATATTGFPSTGTIAVNSGSTIRYVTYTGLTTNAFTGCSTATSFVYLSGNAITMNYLSSTASNLAVSSVSGFATSGTIQLTHAATPYVVAYTGVNSTTTPQQFTNCTITSTVQATASDAVASNVITSTASTLNLSSTSGFPSSGTATLYHSGTAYGIAFTGNNTGTNQLTGCTPVGLGVSLSNADAATYNVLSTTSPSFINVSSISGFPTTGTVSITHSGTTYTVALSSTGTTYLAVGASSSAVTLTNGDAVTDNYLSATSSVLNVASSSAFASSGTIYVTQSGTVYSVTYTGVATGQFTGCTISSGALSVTNGVTVATETLSTSPSTLTVASTTGFASSGTLLLTHSSAGYYVTYTGATSTAFTGCTIASGNVTVSNGDSVADNYLPTSSPGAPLTVSSVTGFPSSGGTITVTHAATGVAYNVTYTGVNAGTNTFTGCVAASGPIGLSTSDTVAVYNTISSTPSALTVAATTWAPSSGTLTMTVGGVLYTLSYTGFTSGQFTGVTTGTGVGPVSPGVGTLVYLGPLSALSNGNTLTLVATSLTPMFAYIASTIASYVVTQPSPSAYTFSAYVRASSTTRSVMPSISFYDSTSTFISTFTGTVVVESASTWTLISVSVPSASVPSNAAYIRGQLLYSANATNEVHYVSNAMLTQQAYVAPWVAPGSGIASARTLAYNTAGSLATVS